MKSGALLFHKKQKTKTPVQIYNMNDLHGCAPIAIKGREFTNKFHAN